jgi:hypothetical protein
MPRQIRQLTDRIGRASPALATFALLALPIILAACSKGGGSGY